MRYINPIEGVTHMIYHGGHYRTSKTVVILPFDKTDENPHYVKFGRLVPRGKKIPKSAVKTFYSWGAEEDCYAVPIPLRAYSRTNLAYGKDGRTYLAFDGSCYTGVVDRYI